MTIEQPSSSHQGSDVGSRKLPESKRSLLGQFLKFLGLMTTIGGSLSILRTQGVEGRWFSGPQLFFTLLIPIGLVVWCVGFWLCGSDRRSHGHG